VVTFPLHPEAAVLTEWWNTVLRMRSLSTSLQDAIHTLNEHLIYSSSGARTHRAAHQGVGNGRGPLAIAPNTTIGRPLLPTPPHTVRIVTSS
jgi:hypothetical protein